MKKTILSLISIALLSLAYAPEANATDMPEAPVAELEVNPVSVTVDRNSILVKNAEGQLLQIYSITGELVYNQHIDSSVKSLETANFKKGCYIVKIGKFTRKIIIK